MVSSCQKLLSESRHPKKSAMGCPCFVSKATALILVSFALWTNVDDEKNTGSGEPVTEVVGDKTNW